MSGIAVPHVRQEFSSVRRVMLTIKGTKYYYDYKTSLRN